MRTWLGIIRVISLANVETLKERGMYPALSRIFGEEFKGRDIDRMRLYHCEIILKGTVPMDQTSLLQIRLRNKTTFDKGTENIFDSHKLNFVKELTLLDNMHESIKTLTSFLYDK